MLGEANPTRTAKSGINGQPLNNFPLFSEAVGLTGSAFFDSLKNGFSQRRKDRKDGMRLGYLLNFGEAMMKTGITRTVNGLRE